MSIKNSLLRTSDKDLLNAAIEQELYASNHYKYAASCLQKQGYFGCQKFFEGESADELEHYYKIRDFFNDRGDEADMPSIDGVEFKDESIMGIFMTSFKLEKSLGDFYNKFYMSTSDAAVQVFLKDLVEIQTKAIGEYGDLIARLELCANNPAALLIFDQELGK
jgi:ferritin